MPMIPMYQPQGDSIGQLLLRQGDIAARGAERSGQIWGGLTQQLGQIGGQALQNYQEQKSAQRQQAVFADALSSYDPAKPLDTYRKLAVLDPKMAGEVMRWLGSLEKPAYDQKSLEFIAKGVQATRKVLGPEVFDSQVAPGIIAQHGQKFEAAGVPMPPPEKLGAWLDEFMAPPTKAPGTRQVEVTRPDGSKTVQIVEDRPGQTFESAAPAAKPDTRSIELQMADALSRGDQATYDRLLSASRAHAAATRAPKEPGTGTKFWVVRDGKTVRIGEDEYKPGDQPTSIRDRPSSGAEKQGLSFYLRAKNAADDLAKMEDEVTKFNLAEQGQLQWAPNIAQTDTQQLYRQSQRAFTEARLRKDSGATIKKDEYESDARTYFAQPGDSQAVLTQKRRARAKVLEALRVTSGRAYDEHFGTGEEALPDPGGLR